MNKNDDRDPPTVVLARDAFSARMRELAGNPGISKASSRIDLHDFYGNLETWTVDTFRAPGEPGTAFIQQMTATGALRLMLPPKVMEALGRQNGSVVRQNRRRAARQTVSARRAEGLTVGNPEALARARKARKRSKGKGA